MKIVYFSMGYSPHDHRFLSALAKTEHKVYFVRLAQSKNESEDRIVPTEIEQVIWEGGQRGFRWRDVPRYVRGLRRVIKRIQPDVLHAGPIQTVGLVAVLTGFRPILMMSWGFDLMEDVYRSLWWEQVTRFVLKHSTFFTSDAQVTRDKAVVYGMNSDRAIVFPWGVDLEHFRPSNLKPANPPTLSFFCNRSWEPRYGVDILAKAFVQAAKSRPDLSLILLAGGSQAGAIRRILISGGVMDRVHLGGFVKQDELPRYYNMADVYISPSHVDGSSVSLMEAMACGLPCLVSDIPENKEWVTEGENGWLFSDGNVAALTEVILRVAEKRDTLPEIGANARAVAEARADWSRNFQKLLEAYE
ncbi:MAG: glycosyltransferase family 4 protein, partial [Anaerolineales bacterium]|nr:glycosyltransferase family 4 protein [Anaerolineales bacterium]